MKPENILLKYDTETKKYVPKIIDFGLAEKEDLAKVLYFLSNINLLNL